MTDINIISSFYTDEKNLSGLSLQNLEDGTGKVYKKSYEISINAVYSELEEAFLAFKKDMNSFSENPLVQLPENDAPGVPTQEGDRLLVEFLGPYNGPMEVIHSDRKSLKLQTLENHPKAGSIAFMVERDSFNHNLFRVETESRSKDFFFHLAKSKTPIVTKVEDSAWRDLCLKFKAKLENKDVDTIDSDLVRSSSSELDYDSSIHS